LLDEHDHSTGKGGIVSHGDTSDGVISGTYLDHDALNTHVQGAGTSASPDDPGGSQGVHGLISTAYVMGILTGQYTMQVGTGTTDGATEINGSGYYDQTEEITYPSAFSSDPAIFIVPLDSNSARVGVTLAGGEADYTAKFKALVGFPSGSKATGAYAAEFMWVAIGPLA